MKRCHSKRSQAPALRRAAKRAAKAQYRVRNWAAYNQSLVKRGSITLWISDAVLDAWQPTTTKPRSRGGQKQYSDGALECLLMVKAVYHLTLRATEGFAQSLCHLLKEDVLVPDYTTLCRRAKTLTGPCPRRPRARSMPCWTAPG